jgi:hypothetical protein
MNSSTPFQKHFVQLVFLYILLLIIGYLFVQTVNPVIPFSDIAIAASVFSIISFITLFIFFRGRTKEPDSQTLYVLVAISLKFLLEIVFALIWLIVVKKTSLPSVLMFFVLYLTLTLFTILNILKSLKNKVI